MSKQIIHLNPNQKTTYTSDHANTIYVLDKGAIFDPSGDDVNVAFAVAGRDFHIAGALKGSLRDIKRTGENI